MGNSVEELQKRTVVSLGYCLESGKAQGWKPSEPGQQMLADRGNAKKAEAGNRPLTRQHYGASLLLFSLCVCVPEPLTVYSYSSSQCVSLEL